MIKGLGDSDRMRDPLCRYNSVLKGTISPVFKQAKNLSVEFTQDMSEDHLWTLHSEALSNLQHIAEDDDLLIPSQSLLDLKLALSQRMLSSCSLCERDCGADRAKGEIGYCGVKEARIASHFIHYGEEKPLVPSYTVFFAGCNFECCLLYTSDAADE